MKIHDSILITHPKVAAQWHPTKNGSLKPENVTYGSNMVVWWFMLYTDPNTNKTYPFVWENTVKSQTKHNSCPYLTGKAIWPGYNDLSTTHPNLAKQWHYKKNGTLTPNNISAGSHRKVWWQYLHFDKTLCRFFLFEWEAIISNRIKQPNCPYLVGRALWVGFNDLATTNPKLASEWHPIKNGSLKPTDVMGKCGKKVWWQIKVPHPITGEETQLEWEATVLHRSHGEGCPYLTGLKVLKGFNDFATINPEKAAEWHPTKNGKLKPTDVTAGCNKKVWWRTVYYNPKTKTNEIYEWPATVANISAGYGCPYLTASKIERLVYQILSSKNIKFEAEKTFADCLHKKPLRFDYFILDDNILIETDGIQHFSPVTHFGGKMRFDENRFCDNIKNDFCKSQNIPLLRIPYIYDPVVDKDKIEKFVLDFIQTKQVPQEIIEFYAKYPFSNYCK